MKKLAKTQHLGHLTFFHSSRIIVIYETNNFQNFPIFFLTIVQKNIKKINLWGQFLFQICEVCKSAIIHQRIDLHMREQSKTISDCVTF